ncbi:MAG TPA: hypothetical protein VH186_27545 [Chloroflexia bacterium]|nr:hypothetical protein [Chloroflexia bacterium]
MILQKAYLRIRQFTRSMQARPLDAAELGYIEGLLTPAQFTLFNSLPLYEQRHALNVCRTLVKGGFGADRELLQAGLLHDMGKFDPATGRVIPVWVKVANVALTKICGPGFVAKLASTEDQQSWRYLFWLQAEHEKRGAGLVQAAGGSQRVVALVGGGKSAQPSGDLAFRALRWADDLN